MDSKVLNEHLKGVADAIRAKKGTTDLINPQDFAEEISTISGGGGDSNIEYLDVSGLEDLVLGQIPLRAILTSAGYRCKYNHPNGTGINVDLVSQVTSWAEDIFTFEFLAVEIDFKANYTTSAMGHLSIEEYLSGMIGVTQGQLDSIPRITKEQFYSLD